MDYIRELKLFQNYYEQKKAGERQPASPFKMLSPNYCQELTKFLSSSELIRNEAGLVSAKDTLLNIEDDLMRAAVKISLQTSRSDILLVSGAKNPEYASLTPLLMYAHKKYNKVMYEEWDKDDSSMSLVLGNLLGKILDINYDWYEVKTWLKNHPDKCAELRSTFLGGKVATAYYGKEVIIDMGDKIEAIKGTAASSKILFQTWLAHSSLRFPGAMILDLGDWDNTPEPYEGEITAIDTGGLPW
jgi:hypothetical protein